MSSVRVAGYRIASTKICFYALLFRRPRGGKYRNNCVWIWPAMWKQHLALPWTANTRALLRKGRYDTTRLSQRRARGPIRRQLAVRCAAQKQARFIERPINAVSLANYIAKRDSSRDMPKQHYSGERPDILSERPTAVTTATIFITLTTVQSLFCM